MKARLFARYGPEAGFELEFGAEATIGRGRENTVLLSSPEVSSQHARIVFDGDSGAYWLEDLDSLNGTQLDGQPVSERERMGELHVLGFGGSAELFFVELDHEAEAETGAVETIEKGTRIDAEAPTLPPGLRRPVERESTRIDDVAPTLPVGLRAKKGRPDRAAASGGATRVEQRAVDLPASLAGEEAAPEPEPAGPGFLLEIVGAAAGRFELREGDNLVGRSGRAQVVLAHRELSRRHATLRVAEGRVWLRDEGSRNHTWVDDEEIAGEVEIGPGSELRFGRLRARLVAAGAAEEGAAGAGPADGEAG